MAQNPPDPHGTGYPELGFAPPICQSLTVPIHPANNRQKVTHADKTAQDMESAEKACVMVHPASVCIWPN